MEVKKKKLIDNNKCIESCENHSTYKYEYNGCCYQNCTNGYFFNNITLVNECKCELEKCFTCPPVALNKNLCTKCNNDYYPKENDPLNLGDYFNCYKKPQGFYLDLNDSLYKKCFNTCKTCNISGSNLTHNCFECNQDYPFAIKFNNYNNCYLNCSFYYYFDNEQQFHCTSNFSCPEEFPILKKDKNECIKYDIKHIMDEIPQFINTNNETGEISKEEEIQYYDSVLEKIESGFTSENYDTSNLDNGEEEIITTEKMTITFTTTQNQKNNSENNMTTLNLGECEIKLRKYYNLSNNETLYIKKIDIIQEGMKIPKVEYDIYCKLSGKSLQKLNLSICENTKISLSVPIQIPESESLDKLNASSGYYNDICYSSTSDSGTDISLKDRKKEFVENNKTICQDDCKFYDYNHSIQKANCSCEVKESSTSFNDMNINKEKLYENFGESKKEVSNLGITSCNVLGSKENIESNTGFFLLIVIIAIFIIIFIIFCSRGYDSLENTIDEVINKKFKKETKNKKSNNRIKTSLISQTNQMPRKRANTGIKSRNKKNNTKKLDSSSKISVKKRPTQINVINQQNNIKNVFHNTSNKNKKSETGDSKPDTDYEFNWLQYKEAIRYDKRVFCDYYGSLLRSKQLIIFTFCSFNDYNSGIVKKFVFFLSFALHYTTNALFFDESTFHQIYEDEGKFNFEYQIPKILYSAISSTLVLRLILRFLVLTDKDILEVKKQKNRENALKKKEEKLKCMKIKFSIFFILIFILLVAFWYYLTCFNAIYKNTQVYLIENTFISFGFSLSYPFIINIFPSMMRMISLHSDNKDQDFLYKLSKIIQII